jgi:hypothetical protein
MRSVGLGLALIASVQFAVLPAFAADATQSPAKTAAAKKKKKPAKTTTEVTVRTTSGDVPASPPAAAPDVAAPATPAPAVQETPAPPAPPAAAAPVPAPSAPVNPPGTVTVHVDSPKAVSLEKRADANSPWQFVCNSPCDIPVPTSDQYHIVGVDLNDSRPFVLDASLGDKVTLDVAPGNHNKATHGEWILLAGGALAVGGIVTLLVGSKNNDVAGDTGVAANSQNTDVIFVGSALIVAGLVAGITGGAFMYDNAHTKVEGGIGAVPDKKTDVKVQMTAARLPQWREDTGPQLAPTRSVSFLQGTF